MPEIELGVGVLVTVFGRLVGFDYIGVEVGCEARSEGACACLS